MLNNLRPWHGVVDQRFLGSRRSPRTAPAPWTPRRLTRGGTDRNSPSSAYTALSQVPRIMTDLRRPMLFSAIIRGNHRLEANRAQRGGTLGLRPKLASAVSSILLAVVPPVGAVTEPSLEGAIREAQAETAEQLLHGNRTEVRSAHFRVITDIDKSVAISIAQNLEVVYSTLDRELWPEETTRPSSDADKIRAYVFGSGGQYAALCQAIAHESCEMSCGHYVPGARILAFHIETGFKEILFSVLIHETVHAYLDHRITEPGEVLPRWLNEGLADYVGYSRLRRGRLRLGVFCKKTFYRTQVWGTVYNSLARETLKDAKKSVRKNRETPLVSTLLEARWEDWHDPEEARSLYGQAWMFVTFLRHGRSEWKMDHFPRFVLGAASGEPADQILLRVYGRTPAELDAWFKEWVVKYRTVTCRW